MDLVEWLESLEVSVMMSVVVFVLGPYEVRTPVELVHKGTTKYKLIIYQTRILRVVTTISVRYQHKTTTREKLKKQYVSYNWFNEGTTDY